LYVFTLAKTKYTLLSEIRKTREEIIVPSSAEWPLQTPDLILIELFWIVEYENEAWDHDERYATQVKSNENLIQNFARKVPGNDSE
jgi:hypothetical protein